MTCAVEAARVKNKALSTVVRCREVIHRKQLISIKVTHLGGISYRKRATAFKDSQLCKKALLS